VTARPEPVRVATDTATGASRSTVALLRVDVGLRAAVPPAELPFAERALVVPCRRLGEGQWSPEALLDDGVRPFAALLLRGLVTHDVMLGGRRSANLLAPTDVFRPWRSADTCLPCETRWSATGGAAVAVLDEHFVAAARRWPGLSAVVHERLAEQLDIAAVRAAIVGLPRVEERVLALFWQLADRWGVVRPDGVVIKLALTHALIGHLVGAQRPTVSLALRALVAEGVLHRGPTGAWTLSHDSLATLAARPARLPDGANHRPGPRPEDPEHPATVGLDQPI
jgi:CRP/FNR family cyclic AMP-dependent transcriptional regulator